MQVDDHQEGREPDMLYLYKAGGIYESYNEIPGNPTVERMGSITYYSPEAWDKLSVEGQDTKKNFSIQPDDVRWHDVNDDGAIDRFNQVKVGNMNPHWMGSSNTTLSWRGPKLYARFDFVLDFWAYENLDQGKTPRYVGHMRGSYNVPTLCYDTWLESNPDTKYPRFLYTD